MQLKNFIICCGCLVAFASCSTFRNATKNIASAKPETKRSGTVKRQFLDGIEVTPGGTVAPENKAVVTTAKTKKSVPEKETPYKPEAYNTNFNIENANMLQLKYAVLTDALVEKLTNIQLLQVIDKWWGTKYCMGGSTDGCIDCSAFTQIIMRDVYHASLPRTSQEQFSVTEKVELEDLREGDLVFFNTSGKDVTHVGVYLLNNKFVHAATSGGVMISDLNEKYWQPKFRGAGRVITN